MLLKKLVLILVLNRLQLLTLLVVTFAMLFLFVTVRVVCSLMDAGIALAEENSLTI